MNATDIPAREQRVRWVRWVWGAAALAAAAYLLVDGHGAHAASGLRLLLPWLIVLSCPLMHMFGHGRHGHGGHRHRRATDPAPGDTAGPPHAGDAQGPPE